MSIDIEKDSIKTALKKLKARENTFKRFEALANVGSWEVDLKTNKSTWSDNSYKIYGYNEKFEPTLDTFFSNLLPEYVKPAKELLEKAIKTKQPVSFYAKAKRQDGKVIDILVNGQVIYDEIEDSLKVLGVTQDITEHLSLKQEIDEIYQIIDSSFNEIYIVDIETLRYLYVNSGAIDEIGYSKSEFLSSDIFLINPYITMQMVEVLKNRILKEKYIINRTIHRRKDGSEYPAQAYIQQIKYKNRDAVIIFETDITELVKIEQKHKEQANILENIHDGVFSVDFEQNIYNINKSAIKMLGYDSKDELKTKTINQIYSNTNKIKLQELLDKTKANCSDCHRHIEAYLNKKNGDKILCDLYITPLYNENDEIYSTAWLFEDITDKKAKELLLINQSKALEYHAYHDILTELPNRLLLNDRISQAINYSKRYNKKLGILFIDLDKFKNFNDTYGHHFGDELLLEVTKRLKKIIRSEDTLARIGGDEFVLLVRNINSRDDLKTIAQKILDVFVDSFVIDDVSLYITCSIGISIFPEDSKDKNELLKFADAAMYRAKELGKSRFEFYSKELTDIAFTKVNIEKNLIEAIKKGSFDVFYQPLYNSNTKTIIGMEALVRWIDGKKVIPPIQFLDVAYESGLIVDIDRIVIQKVFKDVSSWYKSGLNPGRVSINLNMQQLLKDDFLDFLDTNLKKYSFDTGWLEFEVTESEIMKDPQKSIDLLKKLSSKGIKLSVDDFGTGYSSLAYLKRLPIDKVKIDRAFIKDIDIDNDDKEIVNAIIALSRSLKLEVLAEGVETIEQLNLLKESNCYMIQGYYISKPVDSNSYLNLLKV